MAGRYFFIKMGIKVKKVKLSRGNKAEVSYFDDEGNSVVFRGDFKCHKDLVTAMNNLIPYFAEITEQAESASIDWRNINSEKNVSLLRKLEVTGIGISEDEINRTVTLSGRRTLMSSKSLSINAPGVDMTDTTWRLLNEFDLAVEGVIFEATEYVIRHKRDELQTEIDFGTDDPFAVTQTTECAWDITDNV